MLKHVGKKGDTLVEVTLAVGIFSMVAISIVSVINGSTSSAQTALEATLTREEIDAQAEALRFIHASAVADERSENPYMQIWNKIANLSINRISEDYPPSSCSDLYSGDNAIDGKAFVIDTHALGNPDTLDSISADQSNIGKIVIQKNSLFKEATTYPHLVYTDDSSSSEVGSLIEEGTKDYLKSVEGIYVIAVSGPSTNIVGKGSISASYDFYIRTCWYGAGERKASTISTVIRLYNPAITQGSE